MKQRLAALLMLFAVAVSAHAAAAPETEAPNAILTDGNTGLVLYEKAANEKVYPASTTKIVTAVIALENENREDVLTASDNAVNGITFDSSKIYLKVGEQMSYNDLIYALMVESANDAAVVLAESISGSEEAFVARMNEKVKEIGAENTHFTNVHGLHDDNHYTTASDMAKIARYAMSIPGFEDIVSTKKYTIPPTNMTETERTLINRNELLNSNKKYYFEPAVGIKTGHTSKAGYCLVSAAKKGDKYLIAAVFGDKATETDTYSFVDSRRLLSYGINDLPRQVIAKKGDPVGEAPIKNGYDDKAILQTAGEVAAILPEGADISGVEMNMVLKENIKAPVKAEEVLGYAEYFYKGTLLAKTDLTATGNYKKMPLAFLFKPVYKLFKYKSKTIFLIIGVLIVLYIILYRIAESRKRRRERRRKMEARRKLRK